MSVTMTKAEGVTVLTLTSDPQSSLPPICQILKGLCYSPVCCSVSQHLRRIQGTSQLVLGTMQIMVGLLNIGLGGILLSGPGARWQMDETKFPIWLGALFILFGAMNILSEKQPSPCLVILNVMLNIIGVAFAITAIVLYSINTANIWLWWDCDERERYRHRYYDDYDRHTTTTTPSPQEKIIKEKCMEAKYLTQMLLRSISAVLIVLSVLELCLTISSAVLGIKTMCHRGKKEEQSPDDPELYKPLLEEVTSNPAV
ncbi:membrane-spanning 4-domains subfamily A member 8-like [Xyrichtys novacula]|uniref:Membrane-spanning 4-domains subfamily A member 8-like n=1 Tax=Xyrichtys novacula TaxID=13765 RepID=A0AAV1FN85_XYRNO|nr:membrane-spanning 4-domains subfamily A member 8-like [Xyrichtys novacula]